MPAPNFKLQRLAADVDDLLARGVRDALVDKSHGAEDDENESDKHYRFHVFNLLF